MYLFSKRLHGWGFVLSIHSMFKFLLDLIAWRLGKWKVGFVFRYRVFNWKVMVKTYLYYRAWYLGNYVYLSIDGLF